MHNDGADMGSEADYAEFLAKSVLSILTTSADGETWNDSSAKIKRIILAKKFLRKKSEDISKEIILLEHLLNFQNTKENQTEIQDKISKKRVLLLKHHTSFLDGLDRLLHQEEKKLGSYNQIQ